MLRFVTDQLKRGWDRLRRHVAIGLWDRRKVTPRSFNNRVVFIRWDAKLGDSIVLSWVWRELQRQRPDLSVTVITSESFKDLFVRGFGVNAIYVAGKRHGWRLLADVARDIAHPTYVVHLSEQWRARDMWFVRRLAPKHVVGLDDGLNLVDIKLGEKTRDYHFSEKLVPWLEQLGVDTSHRQYWIPRLPEAKRGVDQWWPAQPVIGFCPYGASAKRRLSIELIKQIIGKLLELSSGNVLLFARSHELNALELQLAQQSWYHRVLLKPAPDLFHLFEQAARCEAMVSVDTAAVHLATGLDLPMLALYAPQTADSQNMRSWHPRSTRAVILIAQQTSQQMGMDGFDSKQLDDSLQSMVSLIDPTTEVLKQSQL